MPCSRCEACKTKRDPRNGSAPLSQEQQRLIQQHQQLNHHSPATIRRLQQENQRSTIHVPVTSSSSASASSANYQQHQYHDNNNYNNYNNYNNNTMPPCRSPNRLVEYQRRLDGTDQQPGPMPLFQDSFTPRQKYSAGQSLTLGPVTVNKNAMLRRSMEKLPVQPCLDDEENAETIAFENMWTNPDLKSPRPSRAQSEKGVGNVRWWREHVPFSVPYSPEVCDYDPNWINSAVQRVISDRGVTVHKLPSYAPQFWDPAAASNLGQPTTTGAARSWSLEERAARSVGSCRAPVGVSLRCNHFLGNDSHLTGDRQRVTVAGKCIDGQTASCLMSLARPKTISRGCERASSGLSLAKHSFAYEQSTVNSYPGIYPNIGPR